MPQSRATVSLPFRPKPGKLLTQVREVMRYHHYSIRTERTYIDWIIQYIKFNGTRHPREMGKAEVERFLSHLAVNRNVSVSTQNQAMHALLFLYKQVLGMPLDDKLESTRSRKPKRLPVVLSRDEVSRLLAEMEGTLQLICQLMYGSGLRVMEAVRLRVQDLDFDNHQLIVRDGKGAKDRSTLLPEPLVPALRKHLERARKLHEADLRAGCGEVYLPGALAQKYPGAPRAWNWQYVFPARTLSRDPCGGKLRRHHAHEASVQKAVFTLFLKWDLAKNFLKTHFLLQ